jgi:hypothetical protein
MREWGRKTMPVPFEKIKGVMTKADAEKCEYKPIVIEATNA